MILTSFTQARSWKFPLYKVCDLPREKIREATEFISRFDYETLARETVTSMLQYLEESVA